MLRRTIISLLVLVAAVACTTRSGKTSGKGTPETRPFPMVSAPRVMTGEDEIVGYLAGHFWDSFADTSATWLDDSLHIAGVDKVSVEEQVGTYVTILSMVPLDKACAGIDRFYRRIAAFEEKDPSSTAFEETLDLMKRYLYDANSPVRNEDIYGALAQLLADSPYIAEELRPSYGSEAGLCALNRIGTKATDFRFIDRTAREYTLYGIKAPWTLLFFSNPGCHNCAEVIAGLNASQKIRNMVDGGLLAIVNVYIDEDMEAWREHLDDYPASWHNGFDSGHLIRDGLLYNVRAIPSLYVLDADKTVVMKDAPEDRVLAFIESINE